MIEPSESAVCYGIEHYVSKLIIRIDCHRHNSYSTYSVHVGLLKIILWELH